jgi:DNA-binding transcriptional LysR family regulator
MQDLNDMAYFAEVVDQGSFAAAARVLGLPKSRLSRRVAELEARLGVRLLQRTTRSLSLTAAGEAYHRHCVAMRESAEAAADAIAQLQSEPRGSIRITCPVTLAQGTVGALVPAFLARYPQVRVEMEVDNRVVDLVREGIDIALRVRATLEEGGSLIVKPLGRTHSHLVASPGLLQRCGQPTSPDELQRLPAVAMAAADGCTRWPLQGPQGQLHELAFSPVYVADDLLTLKFAALRGTGMTVLPDYMVQAELDAGTLQQALPGWGLPPALVHAVFPSRRGMVPAVRRFLDFLAEHAVDARQNWRPAEVGQCPADLA